MQVEKGLLESKGCVDAIQIVTKIFNDNNIDYWIDYGVLLGVMRTGRIIPYDDDVDMGMLASQKELKSICALFEKEKIRAFISDGPNQPIHFEKKEGYGFEYIHVEHFSKSKVLQFLSILICRMSTRLYKSMIRIIQRYYSMNEFVRPKTNKQREKSLFCRLARNMIPVLFCGSFRIVQFYGFDIQIPEKAEELIVMRYGKDWKIPKRRGDYLSYTVDH